ncbi:MAG: hypothetical protein ABR532_05870 [Candidatus Dormibacteria bacterium]
MAQAEVGEVEPGAETDPGTDAGDTIVLLDYRVPVTVRVNLTQGTVERVDVEAGARWRAGSLAGVETPDGTLAPEEDAHAAATFAESSDWPEWQIRTH